MLLLFLEIPKFGRKVFGSTLSDQPILKPEK